jgi:hypothetical protein
VTGASAGPEGKVPLSKWWAVQFPTAAMAVTCTIPVKHLEGHCEMQLVNEVNQQGRAGGRASIVFQGGWRGDGGAEVGGGA